MRFRLRFKKSLAIAVAMPWCTWSPTRKEGGYFLFGGFQKKGRAPNPPFRGGEASSKPTTEFVQPRLSRVKRRVQIWVCLFLYGRCHEDAGAMAGHIGTNTRPNLYPLAGDDRSLTLLKRGCANSVVRLELADNWKSFKNPPANGVVRTWGRTNLTGF